MASRKINLIIDKAALYMYVSSKNCSRAVDSSHTFFFTVERLFKNRKACILKKRLFIRLRLFVEPFTDTFLLRIPFCDVELYHITVADKAGQKEVVL